MTRICVKMWIYHRWLLFIGVVWIQSIIGQSLIIDSRCYLDGGGSAESFLASEDLPVGSVIGKLRINGNPSLDAGNISLSLRERDTPVSISPGTKELVLVTALDKEGVHGPASVYVNVICDRRHSSDPSFVIPVNIRVTDVNDNAPQWIGAPYILSLSEVTVPGTRILQGVRAVDNDQQGPFSTVEYKVVDGPYSDYVSFVTQLEGTLVLRKPLDYELVKNFTITLRAQDHGTPPKYSDTTLDVVITDADDQNPKFLKDSYWAELPMDGKIGELKVMPEPIRAIDQDEGIRAPIQYSLMTSPESRYFAINPRSGAVSITSPIAQNDFVHSITLVIKATQVDNNDRYALTTLIIGRRDYDRNRPYGSSLSFLQPRYSTKVSEDIGIGSRLMALTTNRPGRQIQYLIPDQEQTKYFRVGPLGEIILQKSLDYENATKHIFQVIGSDGVTNATTEVVVEVLDVNDWEPRFRQPSYEFGIPKVVNPNELIPLGKLEAADGDRDDKVNINIRGNYAEFFQIDPDGMLWLKPDRPNVTAMHLVATASDSGLPTRSSSVPVTVTNDGIALAQTNWAPGILGAFGAVLSLFLLTIFAMCVYIYKQKEPKVSRNRVHSHDHSTTSGAKLVNGNDKSLSNGHNHQQMNPNVRLGNPLNTLSTMNNNNHLTGSGSSISAGASTILAATLEREAQRDRDMENYTATVRSIISRASAARGGGHLYDDDLEHDSISNSETNKLAWNLPEDTRAMHMPKKLSWNNGGTNPLRKTDTMDSNDMMGSTENTVYF